MNTQLRFAALTGLLALSCFAADRVQTDAGVVEGAKNPAGIRAYLGIPFAAPPVGDLRWKAPKPAKSWTGVRKATEFGPRCMQAPIYSDMIFRDKGPSEDCLYLNVWTPAAPKSSAAPLPVMVWIYGGGFNAGASSEPRQDGENLARKGVVVVSMNYRLGLFGFFAHSELTKESDLRASGNYGLLDQLAAVEWVKRNARAFGGDPSNVTIFGESAGSASVSSLVATPLSRGLFHKAILESGAMLRRTGGTQTREEAEAVGQKFGEEIGAPTLAALRAKSATELLDAAQKPGRRFTTIVDGYYFPRQPADIYAEGQQAPVPLLGGWNANEQGPGATFAKQPQTAESLKGILARQFGDKAPQALALYPAGTDEEAKRSAGDLAGDQFTAFSTWKMLERQSELASAPAVYRFQFDQAPPSEPTAKTPRGAYHSAEIPYVFGVLDKIKLDWTADDRKVAALMVAYWTNFAKKGDPNGPGLPAWPAYNKDRSVLHLTATPKVTKDDNRARYAFLESAPPAPAR